MPIALYFNVEQVQCTPPVDPLLNAEGGATVIVRIVYIKIHLFSKYSISEVDRYYLENRDHFTQN